MARERITARDIITAKGRMRRRRRIRPFLRPLLLPLRHLLPHLLFTKFLAGCIRKKIIRLYDRKKVVRDCFPIIVNLSGSQTGTQTTQGSPLAGILGNYIFTPLYNGTYNVALAVTPTGSVLYPGYTNPQTAVIAGGPAVVDFPFVTITPVGAAPTNTPTPTVTPVITTQPTPTSILPAPPASCLALPTPVLNLPAHQLCTASKPTFSATVSDPNADNAWAKFYSNAYETFSRIGSPKVPPGGASTYLADSFMLNTTGGYWWTAYTQSSTCPRSADAPARLINMDLTSPPKPAVNLLLESFYYYHILRTPRHT